MITEKLRERNREYQKTFRCKNRDLCLERAREIKKRWITEGRCTGCGIKLVQGEKRTCVNCGNTIKGELKYAKDIKKFTS